MLTSLAFKKLNAKIKIKKTVILTCIEIIIFSKFLDLLNIIRIICSQEIKKREESFLPLKKIIWLKFF